MRCPRCGKSVRSRRDGQPYFHRSGDGQTCESKALLSQASRAEKAEVTHCDYYRQAHGHDSQGAERDPADAILAAAARGEGVGDD